MPGPMSTLSSQSDIRIGEVNTLEVALRSSEGLVLRAGREELTLPDPQAPSDTKPGDSLDVFIYPENDGQLVATRNMPRAQVGECGLMTAINITRAGAFLDWGTDKDLLVPISQQISPMQKGNAYVVYVYLDPQQRIIGSSKLHHFFDEHAGKLTAGDAVDLLIVNETDMGFKAVVNQAHLGLLYKSDVFRPLRPGQRIRGFIKSIREDGRIDLSLQGNIEKSRAELSDRILAHLKTNQGSSALTDYSPPAAIYKEYGVSKGSYKKALGALYKQRLIDVSKEKITLLKR